MMRAAKLCSASYDSRFQPAEGQFVRVEQFQVTGELFGFIEVDDEQQNAYVVFRGRNSKGNWEGLLRKKPKVKGAALFRFREKLAAARVRTSGLSVIRSAVLLLFWGSRFIGPGAKGLAVETTPG